MCTTDTVCLVDSPTNSLGINPIQLLGETQLLDALLSWLWPGSGWQRTTLREELHHMLSHDHRSCVDCHGPFAHLALLDPEPLMLGWSIRERASSQTSQYKRRMSDLSVFYPRWHSPISSTPCLWNSRRMKERPWEANNSQLFSLQRNKALKDTKTSDETPALFNR